MSIHAAAALIVMVPFAAAVAGLALGRRRVLAQRIAVGGTGLTLLLTVGVAVAVWSGGGGVRAWASLPTGSVPVEIAISADPLGLTLAVLVATVALGVQIYSTAYLGRDTRYGSYAAVVSLLTAAMVLVVLADDLVLLLAGWVVLSVGATMLIGHHRETPAARAAAVPAFVVPYIGDAALLVGIFALAGQAGSFRVSVIASAAEPSTTLTVAMVLVLCGVAGKSAQVPLHVWLPSTVAGPVPVSALIQSATTAAAGAFLVARLYDVFLLAPVALAVLAVIASVTMVWAALAAVAQDDLMRVLAWSTASQLGLVLGGLAVGGYAAGLFHLVSHAASKALLFLVAGSVAYAVGSTLLSRLGGLAGPMRSTYVAATLGFGALAGMPPLAGYFSKDTVLGAAGQATGGGPVPVWAAALVLAAGVLTVLLTAVYAMRAWLLAFHGPPPVHDGPEPPPAMRLPTFGLAAAVVGLGALGLVASGAFGRAGAEVPGVALHWATTALSLVLLVGGGSAAYSAWIREAQQDPAGVLDDRARTVLAAGFGVEPLYQAAVVRPVYALSKLAGAGDRAVIHPYVVAAGRVVRVAGLLPHAAQSGRVRSYVTALLAFVAVLAITGAVVALG